MSFEPSQANEPVTGNDEISSSQSRRTYYFIYGMILIGSLIFLALGWSIHRFEPLLRLRFEIHIASHLNELTAHLLDEVGIAGLIACGLAVTIERFSTREFASHALKLAKKEKQDLKEDLFAGIFGVFVPPEIVDEIKLQILGETFVRKNFLMKYVLQPLPGHSEYVLVNYELTYDIVNINVDRKDRPFTVKAGIARSPIESLSDQAKFIKVCAGGSCCPDPIDDINERIPLKPKGGPFVSINYERGVTVKAGPENAITVNIHSQTVKHLVGGSSYFSVEYPTLDLDLIVEVPGAELNVYEGATPVAANFNWLKEENDHKEDLGHFHWKLQRPLLAFQSIYIVWEPKDPKPQDSVAQTQS